MKSRRFYAYKLNIHQNIFSPDLSKLINKNVPDVLLTNVEIRKNSWIYSITDCAEFENGKDRFIRGNLTRSKQQLLKIRRREVTQDVLSNDELATTCEFLYGIEGEVLIHEAVGRISTDEFISAFSDILRTDMEIGEVIIEPFSDPMSIRDELRKIDVIQRIQFSLIHPNPGKKTHDLYNDVLFGSMGAKTVDLIVSSESGVNIFGDQVREGSDGIAERTLIPEVEAPIKMIEGGGGELRVKGYNPVSGKGKKPIRRKRTFSSKQCIRSISTDASGDQLVDRLIRFIRSIRD